MLMLVAGALIVNVCYKTRLTDSISSLAVVSQGVEDTRDSSPEYYTDFNTSVE